MMASRHADGGRKGFFFRFREEEKRARGVEIGVSCAGVETPLFAVDEKSPEGRGAIGQDESRWGVMPRRQARA